MTNVLPSKVFLLSPAHCGGRRAADLLRPNAASPLARQLAEGTLTLGDAFQFMSGLYFRGKLAYARAFGTVRPADRSAHAGHGRLGAGRVAGRRNRSIACRPAYVITPTRGLLVPETVVNTAVLREFASVDVASADARYREPLERNVRALARVLDADARVILLGSIATGKYLDTLATILGHRLCFPLAFVGRGDMSRGGLLLRAVAAGTELAYTPLAAGVSRRGTRPPRLTPRDRSSGG